MDKLLSNKNVVRVFALLIGILLWLSVNLEQKNITNISSSVERTQRINNVQVVPIVEGNPIHIESISPETVAVVLRGKDTALSKVNTEKAHIQLDLTNVGKGEHVLPLTAVGFPSNVEVIDIVPAQVKVVVDDLQKLELPVEIETTGKPAEGLKVGEIVTKPNRVHVTLPTRLVNEGVTVKGHVSVEGAKEAVKKQVKLAVLDKNGRELDVEVIPRVVDVEVPITVPYKQIPLQIRISGEPPEGYAISKVTQSVENVTVFGEQSVLDSIEFFEGPQVNIQGLTETKEYSFDLPLKNKITLVDPARVTVLVEITSSVTKTVDGIEITAIGQSDAYTTKVIQPAGGRLSLPVEGAPERMENLANDDIQAIIDVTNLPAGIHELPVVFNLPPFIKSGQLHEMKVTVEITSKQNDGGATEVGGNVPPENGREPGNSSDPATDPGDDGSIEAGAGPGEGNGSGPGDEPDQDARPQPEPGAEGNAADP